MKKIVFFSFLITILVSGCFAPLNSVFDNATLPLKNELRISGSYSRYYDTDNDENSIIHLNNNQGFAITYGFTDRFNMSFRYEHLNLKYQYESESGWFDFDLSGDKVNYFGIASKIKLKKDKIALGIPVGIYFFEGDHIVMLDPMLYTTFRISDKFEFNIIPKTHIGFGDNISFAPGASLGLGVSSNLNRWAFRPEIGYDGYLYFGVGMNVNFKRD